MSLPMRTSIRAAPHLQWPLLERVPVRIAEGGDEKPRCRLGREPETPSIRSATRPSPAGVDADEKTVAAVRGVRNAKPCRCGRGWVRIHATKLGDAQSWPP